MLLTPLLLVAADRWLAPRLARAPAQRTLRRDQRAAARAGHHRRLRPLRPDRRPAALRQRPAAPPCWSTTPTRSRRVRRFGWPVFYGDATRLDLLRTAGAGKARVLVLAIDDVEQSVEVAQLVREHFPQLHDRGAGAQRHALLPAARAGRDADRARDAGLGADERAQRARADGLAAAHGAHAGAALSPPQHRAAGADGAALRRREEADRAGQAGPPAARGAVVARARGTAPGGRPPQRRMVGGDARRPRGLTQPGSLSR